MDNPTRSSLVDLRDLQLGDARALLQHGLADSLPALDESPVQYLQSVIDGLCQLSLTDPLTGLTNRRHFESVLETEISAVARSGEAALLLLLDLDHFKQVNDAYGHAIGDAVLKHFADLAGQTLRKIDLLGRLGGEEFAVLLPGTTMAGAYPLAERLRCIVVESPAATDAGPVPFTVSVGVALFQEGDSDANAILIRADRALYRAKRGGRNRVEMHPIE